MNTVSKKKTFGDMTRPYERCLAYGPSTLADEELLAILFRTGTHGKSAVTLAKDVLNMAGEERGLPGLHHLTAQELMQIPGIGRVKAIQVEALCELSKRMVSREIRNGTILSSPDAVAESRMEKMRHLEHEVLLMLMLDTKMRLIREDVMGRGNVYSAPAQIRELFVHALRFQAVFIILVHNHPSGDPAPSEDDIAFTQAAQNAGQIMQVHLADHIIIGDREYYSFREHGYLAEES